MRKDILLPAMAIAGGGAGFALRYLQMASAFDGETNLMAGTAPVTLALFGVLAVFAAAAFVLVRGGTLPGDYPRAFFAPSAGYMTLMTAGSFLFLAAAALGVLEAREHMALWSMKMGQLPIMLMLTVLLCLPAAGAGLLLGKGNYRNSLPEYYPVLATLPAYVTLPWLVALYQENSRQPETWLYGICLLGVVCAALGLYYGAAFAFGQKPGKRCLFFSLTAIMLLLTSLADRPGLFYTVMSLACVLVLLAQSIALARNLFGPEWPEVQNEIKNDSEGETSV